MDFNISLEEKDILNGALSRYDGKGLLLSLRDIIAKREKGFDLLSQKTGINRSNLYKMLSHEGNPRLETLITILNAIGFDLSYFKVPDYITVHNQPERLSEKTSKKEDATV